MSVAYENPYKSLKLAKKKKPYDAYDELKIDLPFRALVIGPSGSGKNVALHNLIKAINNWDTVCVIAKQLNQPLLNELKERCLAAEKKHKTRIWMGSEDLAHLPSLDDYDPTQNNLVIIDDMICESEKALRPVEEYFIRCRHKNVSIAFLTQDYFPTPKKIRRNADLIIIKKLRSLTDLQRICKEYSLEAPMAKVKAMYEASVKPISGDPVMHWFTIDPANADENYQYRNRFDPIQASTWKQ